MHEKSENNPIIRPHYHDNFSTYPELPEDSIEPYDGRMNGPRGHEHALGAKALQLIELYPVVEERRANALEYVQQADEIIERIPMRERVKHRVKYWDGAFPQLRSKRKIWKNFAEEQTDRLDRISSEAVVEVAAAREKINSASQQVKDRIRNSVLHTLPEFIRSQYSASVQEALEKDEVPKDPLEWLLEDSEIGDERLINFLKFNVHAREKKQDNPALNEAYEENKKMWLEGVDRGLTEGWLHQDASDVSEKVEKVEVRFADYFDLGYEERAGYSIFNRKYIVVEDGDPEDLDYVVGHELNHAVLGRFSYTWLNEAVTEHLAQVIEGSREIGDVGTFLAEHDGAYRAARNLLADIVSLAGDELKVEDFSLAYSEGGEAELTGQERLEPKIDAVFQRKDYLKTLSEEVQELVDGLRDKGYSKQDSLSLACNRVRGRLTLTDKERAISRSEDAEKVDALAA